MSQHVNEKGYKYKAFISYSHSADKNLAPALQSSLQKFNTSWNQLYGMRVFRDETDTRISHELWPPIERALAESEFFLLLASPEAARSPWVGREVDYWLRNRDLSKLLILVTGGEDLRWDGPNSDYSWEEAPLPPILKGQLKKEPKHLDLRWAKEDKGKLTLRHQEFYDTVADIAATLQNMDKGVLVGKDARKLRRTKRIAGTAIAMLTLLFASTLAGGFVAYRQWTEADRQKNIALENERRAIENERKAILNQEEAQRQERLAKANADEAQRQEKEAKRQEAAAKRQQGIAEEQRAQAVAQRKIAEERLARSYYSESALEANYGDKERALLLVSEALKAAGPDDPLRDIYALRAIQLGAHAPNDVRVFREYLSPVAFNPADGSFFFDSLTEGKIINAAGEETGNYPRLGIGDGGYIAPSFSGDGRWVAGGASDDGFVAYDTREKKIRKLNLGESIRWYDESAFTSDNSLIVLFGRNRVAAFSRETGQAVTQEVIDPSSLSFRRGQLSLNAGREWALSVASAAPNDVKFVDLRTGKAPAGAPRVLSHEGPVLSAVFSEDGLRVATSALLPGADDASDLVRLSLWDLTTGQRQSTDVQVGKSEKLKVQEVGQRGKVLALIYSGYEKPFIITIPRNGATETLDLGAEEVQMAGVKVALWDAEGQKLVRAEKPQNRQLRGDTPDRFEARFVAGGSLVLLAELNHGTNTSYSSYPLETAHVLSAETLRPIRNEIRLPTRAYMYWVDAGGRTLWAFLHDQRLTRWNLTESERSETKVYDTADVKEARFSADAGSVVINSSLPKPATEGYHPTQGRYIEFARDGGGAREKWSETLRKFDGRDAQYFQVGGDRFIAVVWRTSSFMDDFPSTFALQLIDKQSGKLRPESPLEARGNVTAAAFDPRTSKLTVAAVADAMENYVLKRWDLKAGEPPVPLPDIPFAKAAAESGATYIDGLAGDGKFCFAKGTNERLGVWAVSGDGLSKVAEYTAPSTTGLKRAYLMGLLRQATDIKPEGKDILLVTLGPGAVLRVEPQPPGVKVWNVTRHLLVRFPTFTRDSALNTDLEKFRVATDADSSDTYLDAVYSPNGKWIATFKRNPTSGELQVWELDTGNALSQTIEQPSSLLDISFTADSESLLTIASDAVVRRWFVGAGSAKKPEWVAGLGTMLTAKEIYLAGTSVARRDEYERLRREFLRAVGKEAKTDPMAKHVFHWLTAGAESSSPQPATGPRE